MDPIVIDNISKYSIQFINNKLILTPNNIHLCEPDIYNHINKCNIISCNISEIEISKLKFNSILSDIWNTMTEYDIIKNASYTFKYKDQLEEKDIKNYRNYQKNINMYFCNRSGTETFKEIVKMIKLKKLNMNIIIENENKPRIEFNI